MKQQSAEREWLIVEGARENNLQNLHLKIPRNSIVVFTGLSGSGKSSLAFNTIFAEGQRRYMETFAAYARQFIGSMDRPDVDNISGLSPVVAIEQKSTNRNPRSTVGTVTEIYDFLRLLFAKTSTAISYETGKEMMQYNESQLYDLISTRYSDKNIVVLAPLVKARKGHYRELFEQYRKYGFVKVRIDGDIEDLVPGMQIDRYKIHDIDLWVDSLKVKAESQKRLKDSIATAMKYGKGVFMIMQNNDARYYSKKLMCADTGISYEDPEPNTFSFNSPYGACPKCKGLGFVTEVDLDKVFPDKRLSIRSGGIAPIGEYKNNWVFRQIELIGKKFGFTLTDPVSELSQEAIETILYGTNEVLEVNNEYLGVNAKYNLTFDGIVNMLMQSDQESPVSIKKWAESFMNHTQCPVCEGSRLKKEAFYFRIGNMNIAQVAELEINDLADWVAALPQKLGERQMTIATDIIKELSSRIGFLQDVGLHYLALNRPAYSLSGGESQRIRLATQIGSGLTGVLYVLDEPSIGLHQRDNHLLINSLKKLRDMGNSVIVVEHDRDMILSADEIVDLGPGAGRKGGKIIAQGDPGSFSECHSLTCEYISGRKIIPVCENPRSGSGKSLKLNGAKGNNLKNTNIEIPLGKMIGVTGVSGSGKSTAIIETLYPALFNILNKSNQQTLPFSSIEGMENIDKVIEIDQSPIGRTPRSNPATYIGIFDEIRGLFAELTESKVRGYSKGRFSFNVSGGRCEECKGTGYKALEMNFMSDVYIKCDACDGKRYNRETLELRYKGKNIHDVLELTFEQSLDFFESFPKMSRVLKVVNEVGLGYIKLGQSSVTLSGGEAQRVKLASELIRKDTGKTLYILDEPTTGLHFEDIRILLDVLDKLVDRGNTALIIEHNMDVIAHGDHLIDLGPEGGKGGGQVVISGAPLEVANSKVGITSKYLREYLAQIKK